MNTVHIATSGEYDVLIGRGLLKGLGLHAAQLLRGRSAVIVSDSNVAPLYMKATRAQLCEAGFHVDEFVFPAGEASKCASTYLALLNFLAEKQLTRADALVALGGGVVGDLTGFAAATYLRGIDFIQLPTTLLACVDSAVGGKTAIDLPAGKNLVGAFYQPKLVLCDLDMLDSLPDEVFADGCAEVIKYGMYGSAELLDRLSTQHIRHQLEYVVTHCVVMKRDVVEGDEFDTGRRQFLNFGHTFAHAIETASDYAIPHGRAVAMGMDIITRAAVGKGYCPKTCLDVLEKLLRAHDLPCHCDYSAETLAEFALSDKKRKGENITLVVPTGYGTSELVRVPVEELISWARLGLGCEADEAEQTGGFCPGGQAERGGQAFPHGVKEGQP